MRDSILKAIISALEADGWEVENNEKQSLL